MNYPIGFVQYFKLRIMVVGNYQSKEETDRSVYLSNTMTKNIKKRIYLVLEKFKYLRKCHVLK